MKVIAYLDFSVDHPAAAIQTKEIVRILHGILRFIGVSANE
jgi:hypothetical protein